MDDLVASLNQQSRFTAQMAFLLKVQVPLTHASQVLDAITSACDLAYGDYDHVSFEEAEGQQRFRSTGSGRNAATRDVVAVPCVQISAQLPPDPEVAKDVLAAIYAAHPYEEPVISLSPSISTRHVRGQDEDNPNRFWNQSTPDWVPAEHR